jgi:zinc protease
MAQYNTDDFLPEIYRTTLANGLTVLGVEYDRVPWVSLTLMIKRGAESDPADKGGAADCTAECLTFGTTSRDQLRLALDIESRGASLRARGSWDMTSIAIEGLAEDFPELMALLAEVVQQPGFPPPDFDLMKDRRQAELIHLLDDPREMANRNYYRIFFGDSPYGHPVNGEPASIASLSLEDLKSFYHHQFHAGESSLVVVGMVPEATVTAEATRLWSTWNTATPLSPPYREAPRSPGQPGIYLIDRPALTQSEIRLGHLGLPRQHPDFFPLRLVNYVLGGGGFSSRLMARIRSEKGYTYGINSQFHFRRAPGPFIISTFTPAEHTADVIQEVKEVMTGIKQEGILAEELADAQNYFVGSFPMGLETPSGLARQLVNIDLHNLELDYLRHYRDRIRAVSQAETQACAEAHLHPESLVMLVLGPAAVCRQELEKLGPVTLVKE